jgi:hypothetical protein
MCGFDSHWALLSSGSGRIEWQSASAFAVTEVCHCHDSLPPCCSGSLPSWYGGSVGSIPTGGFGGVRDTPLWSSGITRHPVKVESAGSNPVRGAECWCRHGALIGNRDQAQTLMFVGSTPTRATARRMALGGRADCKPAAHSYAGSIPARRTGSATRLVRPADRTSGSQPENRGSIPRRVTHQEAGNRGQETATADRGFFCLLVPAS